MSETPNSCSAAALAAQLSLTAAQGRRLILLISPCRSGSTALVRAFAALGVEAHHQPLKNLLRWCLLGETHRWQPDENSSAPLLVKETLGPFRPEESLFDPLQLLISAGIPSTQLTLLLLGRTPLETWASWRHWWRGRTRIERFIDSYLQADRLLHRAQALGIETHSLVYELFRDHPPERVMRRVCDRLAIPYTDYAVKDWQQLPRFSERTSGIVIPHMPDTFTTENIRQRVEEASGFHYFSRASEAAGLAVGEVRKVEAAGLPAIYSRWCCSCADELGLELAHDAQDRG